jgi:hypothetical protein
MDTAAVNKDTLDGRRNVPDVGNSPVISALSHTLCQMSIKFESPYGRCCHGFRSPLHQGDLMHPRIRTTIGTDLSRWVVLYWSSGIRALFESLVCFSTNLCWANSQVSWETRWQSVRHLCSTDNEDVHYLLNGSVLRWWCFFPLWVCLRCCRCWRCWLIYN